MTTKAQRHKYRCGARLVRSGGWTNDQIIRWCAEQGITRTTFVLQGANDERRKNPRGESSKRLGEVANT